MDDATAAKGAWDAAQGSENANQAVADPDVMVYIGTFNSGAAKVSIPILCAANLGMISPANTYPGLTKKVEGAVEPTSQTSTTRTAASATTRASSRPTRSRARSAANWSKQLGATKAYVLDDTELYGHGIAVVYQSTAPKVGLQVVGGPEGIDPQGRDYRALAQKIRESGADIVFFGGITQNNAGKLWQDLRGTLGPNVKLMGPDGIYEQAFIDAAGQAAEGTYITFGGVPPSKLTGQGRAVVHELQAAVQLRARGLRGLRLRGDEGRAAGDPDAAAGARARLGQCRGAMRDAIFATKNFDGVLGTVELHRHRRHHADRDERSPGQERRLRRRQRGRPDRAP